MSFSNSSSNSSIQINTKNNYKYDEYGFLLVDSIEDLLYDKFNKEMEKNINYGKNNKTNKKINDKNSLKNKHQCVSTERRIKYTNYCLFNSKIPNKYNPKNKSMKLKLNKNYKEYNILIKKNSYDKDEYNNSSKIMENNRYSKENNITNNQNRNNKNINNIIKNNFVDSSKNVKKKNKNFSLIIKRKNYIFEKQEELIYKPDPIQIQKEIDKKNNSIIDYTFRGEEKIDTQNNNQNENKEKIISTSRPIISKLQKRKENNIFEGYNPENNIFKRYNKYHLFRLPNISQYYMTKIRKENFYTKIKNVIPKTKMIFITKSYSLDKDKSINIRTNILSIPKSTMCYFERNNKIIMRNTSKMIGVVKNNQFFLTKEIIRPKKEEKKNKSKIKPKTQKIKIFKKINNDRESPRIQIKLLNMKNSSISYGKPGKIGIKANWKTIEPHETNINKKSKIFPNHKSMTQRDLYKYKINQNNYSILKNSRIRFLLNKSKKKPNLSGKIYKNIRIKSRDIIEPKIPINNKFKNNLITNYKMFNLASNNLRNTFNQPPNKKLSRNNKNRRVSYISNQHSNIIFFPAIESYFD